MRGNSNFKYNNFLSANMHTSISSILYICDSLSRAITV